MFPDHYWGDSLLAQGPTKMWPLAKKTKTGLWILCTLPARTLMGNRVAEIRIHICYHIGNGFRVASNAHKTSLEGGLSFVDDKPSQTTLWWCHMVVT